MIPLAEDAVINVGATSTPATPLLGVTAWDAPTSRPSTIRKYFMMAPITFVGPPDDTFSFAIDYNEGDPGQSLVRTNYRSGTEIYVQVLPNGVKGFNQKVRITAAPLRGPDADTTPPGGTMDFSATDAPVNVGGGL